MSKDDKQSHAPKQQRSEERTGNEAIEPHVIMPRFNEPRRIQQLLQKLVCGVNLAMHEKHGVNKLILETYAQTSNQEYTGS